MGRPKRRQTRPRTAFPWPDLFLELQRLVRGLMTPVAASMLAMTCKSERAAGTRQARCGLLHNFITEGDADGLLRRHVLVGQGPRHFPAHIRQNMFHDAISAGQMGLVNWMLDDVHGRWRFCNHCWVTLLETEVLSDEFIEGMLTRRAGMAQPDPVLREIMILQSMMTVKGIRALIKHIREEEEME
jgi:hypothetical protein